MKKRKITIIQPAEVPMLQVVGSHPAKLTDEQKKEFASVLNDRLIPLTPDEEIIMAKAIFDLMQAKN